MIKLIFETEYKLTEDEFLAMLKLIGVSSVNNMVKAGLTEEEAWLLDKLYMRLPLEITEKAMGRK